MDPIQLVIFLINITILNLLAIDFIIAGSLILLITLIRGIWMYVNIELSEDSKDEIKIDNYDTWNLDFTLARVIHPALIKFKEECVCYPDNLETMDEWHNIIDKMIYSFGLYDNTDGGTYMETQQQKEPAFQEGIDLFATYFDKLFS